MKLQKLFAVLAITWVLGASSVYARQPQNGDAPSTDSTQPPAQGNNTDDRQTPAPAAHGLFVSVGSQDQNAGEVQPDTHPLSGAVTSGLGFSKMRRLFDPAFRVTEAADSGIVAGTTDSVTSLGGTFVFDQSWKASRFTAIYSGAQTFYVPDSSLSQAYHDLTVSQEIHWAKWGLLLRDDLNVSPQSSFGYLYTGAPGVPGQNATLTDLTPALQTSETILTGPANRLSNTSVAEIDYSLTRRSTVTFVGSYGLFHFSVPGYLGSTSINASTGYNYALSPKNSVAVLYNYSTTRFITGAGQETHLAQLAFGRKVTQRLSFQLGGGPQLLLSRNLGSSNNRSWSWSLSGSLSYQATRNTGYSFTYFHGITAGSGVYLGASTDTLTVTINHKLTRFWSGSFNSGYSRNSSAAPTIVGVSSLYDNWFAGGSLSRQIGREIRFVGSYAYQQQYSAAGACPVLSCGPSGSGRNVVSVSLEWHPFAIQTE